MGLVAGALAVALAVAACSGPPPDDRPPTRAASGQPRAGARRPAADSMEAGGEVVSDSAAAKPDEHWISDANALALLSLMNGREMNAADVELGAWHSDTVRALAAAMARTHAELQHSIDSLVEQIHVAPVAPALAEPLTAQLQAGIDSLNGLGSGLDRAFVRQQVASHQLMSDYVRELAGVAERPEVSALLAAAATRVDTALARAKAVDAMLASGDSIAAADSAARAAARAEARRRRGRGG